MEFSSLGTITTHLIQLMIWIAVLPVVFVPIERAFALHRVKLPPRKIAVNVGWFFVNGLAVSPLIAAPLAVIAWCTHAFIPDAVRDGLLKWPLLAKLVVATLLGGLGSYWGHRWSHEIPLLWRFHSIHHAAEDMTFLVNVRIHPVDSVFEKVCAQIPLYVFGLGLDSSYNISIPVTIPVITTAWGYFIHSNIRWRLRQLDYIVTTPLFHHWHHANEKVTGINFSGILPIFDKIFGTLYLPKRWPIEYGIGNDTPLSLYKQLIRPFLKDKI